MEKLRFSDGWQKIFEDNGFKSFDDFFGNDDGIVTNVNKKRNVISFKLKDGSEERTVYMKRFDKPYYKDYCAAWRKWGFPCSQAKVEWNCAYKLLENGIDTYRPVAMGEDMVCGMERRSFCITEELKSVCMTDWLGENWGEMSLEDKKSVMVQLAKAIRNIHDKNIGLPDLYLWHVFINRLDSNQYGFEFIDLHRMKPKAKCKSLKIKHLGAFDYSMLPEYFDDEVRGAFWESYFENDPSGKVPRLMRKILKRSKVVTGRRLRPRY